MLTVLEIIRRTTDFFSGKGIDGPRLNAELIVGHALGLGRMQLYLQFERPLTEAELEKIRPLVRRRGQREPLQYILGEVEFCGLKLKADRRALIPRPETEYLVELIAEHLAEPPPSILDLGTGTGAIALGLAARFPGARVLAVDASADALALAGENVQRLGMQSRVALLQSDWFAAVESAARFDLIVSNPPYLTEVEFTETEPEVRGYEPKGALTPGEDGLSALQAIIRAAHEHLAAGGLLALETGIHQHAALLEILVATGYEQAESRRDLTGRDRFVFARRR